MTLDRALRNAARGFRVFPARGKAPLITDRFHLATVDPEQITKWWDQFPDANPGVVCGPSNLTVVDVDRGLSDEQSLIRWMDGLGLPRTYAVQTGGDGFRVQLYYRGTRRTVHHELNGCGGEIRSIGAHIMGAGSVHPDTGREYCILWDIPLVAVPDAILNYKPENEKTRNPALAVRSQWRLPVGAGDDRSGFFMEQAGILRSIGCGEDAIRARLHELNSNPAIVAVSKPDTVIDDIARRCAQFALPEPEPELEPLSKPEPKEPKEPDPLFSTADAIMNAPPVGFLIENFLQREGVTGLCSKARQRKTLISLHNMVHSLLTGEPLFGHFKVTKQPRTVVYLCLEMTDAEMRERVSMSGMSHFLLSGRLLARTLTTPGSLELDDPRLQALMPGSVVFLDTAIRFMGGSDTDPLVIGKFVTQCFGLIRSGAELVVMLHHATKTTSDALTLENMVRGGGDLGAFLSCCYGTRMYQPGDWDSLSYLENIKPRNFPSEKLALECDKATGRMTRVDELEVNSVRANKKGFQANKDGMDGKAMDFMVANPKLSYSKMVEGLESIGVTRSRTWVREHKPPPANVKIG